MTDGVTSMSRYTGGRYNPFEARPFGRVRETFARAPRRARVGLSFMAAALVVVLITPSLVGFITENEWYDALGIGSVYRTRIAYEALLFFATFAISLGFATTNVWIALRQRWGPVPRGIGIRRRVVRTQAGVAGLTAGALIALVVAAGARTRWTDLALFVHSTPDMSTGIKEPPYSLDVSFLPARLAVLPRPGRLVTRARRHGRPAGSRSSTPGEFRPLTDGDPAGTRTGR